MPKLTKRTIDAAHPKASGDIFVWDDELPAYGIRVKPSGSKAFILQYRNSNGRSRRLTLGRYGVLTPDAARDLARGVLSEVVRGGDPAERRALDRDALTVADLCREYLDKAERSLILTRKGKAKKPSTLSTDRGRTEAHIIPLLGRRTVKDVTSADVRAFVRDIIAGKTSSDVKRQGRGRSIVKGGPGAAARTVGLLGAIFSYAVGEGYRLDNPTRGVLRPADKKRKVHLEPEQYGALGRRLLKAEQAGEPWQAIEALRLLALTGCRSGKVLNLRRSECDLRGSALRFGDTKAGDIGTVRPIGAPARDLIRSLLERTATSFLFPPRREANGPYRGLGKTWGKLRADEPSIASLSPHGLRHAFASVADDLGFTEATIASLLGHTGGGTTRGYISKVDFALIAAADRVSNRIQSMMAGEADVGAEVIELASATAEASERVVPQR